MMIIDMTHHKTIKIEERQTMTTKITEEDVN